MPTGTWGNETVFGATKDDVKSDLEELITDWCGEHLVEDEENKFDTVMIGKTLYRVEIKATLVPIET